MALRLMLDFSQVITQIHSFTGERLRTLPQLHAALEEAGRRLRESAPTWEATRERLENSRTSWLLSQWIEPPDEVWKPVERPMPHTILAVDGSQIVSDRHDIALCYLINIGTIVLRYGTGERALLHSRPELAVPDEDLLDQSQTEQSAIAPRRLAIRRQLAELAGLTDLIADLARSANIQVPTLGMTDGSLILWTLEAESEGFRREALETWTTHMERARKARVPILGYISKPQSRDVINALRVFQCPHPRADCDRYCPNRARPRPHFVAPDCAGTKQVTDAELFEQFLDHGERTALFASNSKILKEYAEEHRVLFFYLHTGSEVARIEIPHWVTQDRDLLDRVHTLCYDQAHKGDGYPVALAEAHEQAIVRGAERTAFFRMMERAFVSSHLPMAGTSKAISKRARRV